MTRYPISIDDIDLGKLDLVSWRAQPLGLAALRTSPASECAKLFVDFEDVVAVDGAGKTHNSIDGVARSSFTTSYPLGPVALVPGGWLPAVLAGGHHLLMFDRNAANPVVAAKKAFDKDAPTDLLALLVDKPVWVNGLAYVLEGNQKAPPSPAEIAAQVTEIHDKLARALPNAVLAPTLTEAIRGAVGLWSDMAASHARNAAFLTQAYPLLKPTEDAGRRLSILSRLRQIATDAGVPTTSLPFLACFVAVCLPGADNPARRMLKPSGSTPDPAVVYNALSDLQHLQTLIAGNALFPKLPSALLTADRALAEFWVGLGIHAMRVNDGAYHFSIPFGSDTDFFSSLSDAELELVQSR